MKLTQLTIIIAFVFGLVIMPACNGDDTPKPPKSTTVEEDKINIQETLDAAVQCVKLVETGDFIGTIKEFYAISEGDVLDQNWVDDLFEDLDEKAGLEDLDTDNRFIMSKYAGTYTWLANTEEWSYSGTPSNQVIINLPASSSATTNTLVATLSSYADVSLPVDGEMIGFPTTIAATLTKNGTTVSSVTVSNMEYEVAANELILPIKGNVVIETSPLTHTFNLDRATPTQFNIAANLETKDNCNWLFEFKVALQHSDYENLEDEDIAEVSGSIKMDNLSFPFSVEYGALYAIDEPTIAQWNQHFNVDVAWFDVSIGELVFKDSGDPDSPDVMMRYKDGTEEDAFAKFGEGFGDQLESTLFDLLGEWE